MGSVRNLSKNVKPDKREKLLQVLLTQANDKIVAVECVF